MWVIFKIPHVTNVTKAVILVMVQMKPTVTSALQPNILVPKTSVKLVKMVVKSVFLKQSVQNVIIICFFTILLVLKFVLLASNLTLISKFVRNVNKDVLLVRF